MTERIVIAGSTGFIGQAAMRRWQSQGHSVLTIDRRDTADARWGDADAVARVVDGATMLVNMAGRSVNCRYNDRNREAILQSRISTTSELRDAVARVQSPPPVWINASTATTYSHTTEAPHTEADDTGQIGFSEDVARAWEAAFMHGFLPATRRVAARQTIVLGTSGLATRMLFTLGRFGLGGTQYDGPWIRHNRYRGLGIRRGSTAAAEPSAGRRTQGRQRFSWIHVDDAVRVMEHIRDTPAISGPVNFATDDARPNDEFMRLIRQTVGMPLGMPAFRWMLEPAMWALRTESELVLKSRWVRSQVLADTGFSFEHPELPGALADIWRELSRS